MGCQVKTPAKTLRDVRRITKFLEKKQPIKKSMNLCIANQASTSFIPSKKLLSVCKVTLLDIPPVHIPSTTQCPQLSFSSATIVDIPPAPTHPKPYIHPHIIEASKMIYGKPPWDLDEEQLEHFEGYQQYKIRNGRPIEEDIAYKPSDW